MQVSDLKYDIARSELVAFIPSGARRLLDVGCGVGKYGEEAGARRPELELWAIEPDPAHADVASRHFHTLVHGFFPQAATQVPRGHFDVVTFNDVLEHLVEPGEALEATKALLTHDGCVVASIPNVRHRSVVWPLLRHGTWDYEPTGLLDYTHLRFFTRSSMVRLFEERGWRVDSVEGVNLRWDWRDSSPERRKLRLLRRVMGSRLDAFFFVQYVVTARPR